MTIDDPTLRGIRRGVKMATSPTSKHLKHLGVTTATKVSPEKSWSTVGEYIDKAMDAESTSTPSRAVTRKVRRKP